jgi:hypothetical protein
MLELRDRHVIVSHPEYHAVLDDFVNPDGEQMVLMHIDVDTDKFNPTVMKRLLGEWSAFRSVTAAPLYGIEPNPDDAKWERFVSLLGFQKTTSRVDCTDGQSRRLFVSLPQKELRDERQQHANSEHDLEPLGGPDPLPH